MKLKSTLSIIIIAIFLAIQPALVIADELKSSQILMGTVKLTNGNLNVRSGPSTDAEIIGKLPNHAQIEVIEQKGDWASILYNGVNAFVSLTYLSIATVSDKPAADPTSVNKKTIVLDPGHGGRDPGAIAKDGTYESNIVWQYTTKMKKLLEKSGYIVHLTRSEKSSCMTYKNIYDELDCRSNFAEKVKADIFISIHADANPSKSYRGTVTFYNNRSDLDGHKNPFGKESKELAEAVHSFIQPTIASKDQGIKNKNYYVNRMNSVPAILVELGVMTNAADLKLLKDTKLQDKVSAALVKSVDKYFGY